MSTLVACDLDRTLIYSRNAAGSDTAGRLARPGDQSGDLRCVECHNGAEISFMTPTAMTSLRALAAISVVVPTTTRTTAQFQRVVLPGSPFRYAVTSNGGNILVDGTPDVRWHSGVVARISAAGPSISEVADELRRRVSDGWVHSFRLAEDLFCYLVVDLDRQPAEFIADWFQWCAPRGWTVSQQGRKIYTVPETLCKSHAIAEIRRRLVPPPETVVAAGDGALDAELLRFADAAIRPRHGELEALGWQSANTTVTKGSGLAAAEEILQWFLRQVDASGVGASTN